MKDIGKIFMTVAEGILISAGKLLLLLVKIVTDIFKKGKKP